jgi:hypothetical protein
MCDLLGDEHLGLVIYKLLMIRVLEKLCEMSYIANSDDLNIQMTRKLARRLDKLNKLMLKLTSVQAKFIEELIAGKLRLFSSFVYPCDLISIHMYGLCMNINDL